MRTTLDAKQQQAAAVPPPTSLQIRLTDFLTFVVVVPSTKKFGALFWGLPDPQMVIQHVAGGGP